MENSIITVQEGIAVDQVRVVRLESDHLSVDVSPETGGRITRLVHKGIGRDFLWRNPRATLERVEPGTAYDPHFTGGLDDILPCDAPEIIEGLPGPDHGEWWRLPLTYRIEGGALTLHGRLPIWGLDVQKRVTLRTDSAWVDLDYRIENLTGERRTFLWKLHAAAVIDTGDQIVCPAQTASVADPQWSRWGAVAPFAWPNIAGQRADRVPAPDGTTDFLYLSELRAGRVGLRRPTNGCELAIAFDPAVFPYVCLFASYGGFDGHVTAILEPCTAMPLSVVEATRLGQCSVLAPGSSIATRVSLYAGPLLSSQIWARADRAQRPGSGTARRRAAPPGAPPPGSRTTPR